jgi:exopolysaccharide biosynthesis polyprenyl glycosylphosphotransferase
MARVAADFMAVALAFGLCYGLYLAAIGAGLLHRSPVHLHYVGGTLLFAFLMSVVFQRLGLYGERASVLNLWELTSTVKGVLVAAAFFLASLFFLKLKTFSRLVIVGSLCLTMVLTVLERRIVAAALRKRRLQKRLGRRVLILGCGETGRLLMKKIVEAPHLGRTVVGFLDSTAAPGASITCRVAQTGPVFAVPVLGGLAHLAQLSSEVDEVLVADPLIGPGRLEEILRVCERHGVGIGIVPHVGTYPLENLHVEDLSAIPVVRPRLSSSAHWYGAGKRVMDVAGALCLIVLTLPLWVMAALLIRLDSPGPLLFSHERVGQQGRRFRMFKFRTMHQDADPYALSPFGDVDPRITRVGRFLRSGGVDELPQLVNVIRGEMSLVGPRPEMPFIVDRYSPREKQRLQVKPGITGLWQLSADRHAQIHENLEYDLYYLEHRSLLLDGLILLETLFFTTGIVVRSTRDALGIGDSAGEGETLSSTPALGHQRDDARTRASSDLPVARRKRGRRLSGVSGRGADSGSSLR